MSTTIDSKVVEMRFDNKQFESGVQTTLSSLDKLKQGLNLTGASKGLENVGTAANRVNLSGLTGAVETVRDRFSALEVMGITALANITNSAVNAGKRIVSALTIDPIKTGFQEYETQINAVQTILANTESKGTTLDDVNKALDELNTYADKTIYNFTQMTKNIGTFTAAGVDLDTSVNAIQGIANLAAVSGSNSQQASTAMYQLSQALASGTVKLMDWNSVVNAGMGGQVFQDALKETARVHGIAIDDMIESQGSFRETLSEGWLTSEILTETLSKFTMTTEGLTEAEIKANREKWKSLGYSEDQIDAIFKLGNTATQAATKVKTLTQLWDTLKETAQSGWTQTWEIILGDFEGAKSFFSTLYETLAPILESSAKARNELLQGWADAGGRNDLIDSLYNMFDAISSVIKPIKEAFREIFPPTTVDQLVNITKGLKEFTEWLKISDTTSENLKRTFKGVFAVFDIVKQAISAVFNVIKPLFGYVDDAGGGILSLTASWGDWLVKLNETIKTGDIFNKVFGKIAEVIKKVSTFLKETFVVPGMEVFHAFLEKIQNGMSAIGAVADGTKSGVVAAFEAIGSALENCDFFKLMQSVWKGIETIGSAVLKVLGIIGNGLVDTIGNANFDGFFDIINGLISGGIGVGIIKLIKSIRGALDGFPEILDGVSGCLEGFQSKLKGEALMKIAGAIAILAASLLVLSLIDPDKMMSAIAAITMLFTELVVAMRLMSKIGDANGLGKMSAIMLAVSTAVLILAGALRIIGGLDTSEMFTALVGITSLLGVLIGAMKLLTVSGDDTSVIKGAGKMIIVAAAMVILASAARIMADLSWEEMAISVIGLTAMLGAMIGAIKLLTITGDEKAVVKGAGSMLIMATSLVVLASALRIMSHLSWEELAIGLTGIFAALGTMVAAFAIMDKLEKSITEGARATLIMSASLVVLASALRIISALSWSELAVGIVGVVAVLGAMVGAFAIMDKLEKSIAKGAAATLIMASSLVILASALRIVGGLEWGELAVGLVGIGVVLAAMVAAFAIMDTLKQSIISGAAAMLVMSAALLVLTPVLSILGAMSWGSIAKGLISIAGAFVIIGVAGAVLQPIVPAILALAGAIALLGVAIVAIGAGLVLTGAGLSAIAVGIGALAGAVAGGVTSIVAALKVIIIGIADLIPSIMAKIGEGILEFCKVITNGAPAIAEAATVLVTSIIDVLVDCIPALVEGCLLLINRLLSALVEYTPTLVDQLFSFIIGILEGISKNIPTLIQAVVDIFLSVFQGAIDTLSSIDPESLLQGIAAIGLLAGLMIALSALAALTPAAMIGVLGMGAVLTELAIVLAAVGALSKIPGLEWLISEGGQFLQTIGTAIGQFIGGIAGGFAQGFSSSLPQIGSDLSTFMTNLQPFIDGAKSIDDSLVNGVKSLVGVILAITGANIIEGITSWITGGSSITKFAEELPLLGQGLKGFSDAVTGIIPENIIAAAEAAKALSEMTNTIPNEGGVVGWFAGENSIAKFGSELPILGAGLKSFSDSVAGIVPENIIGAANAAKALTEMTSSIPNEGGVVAWFTGENSISKFASDIITLGFGLKGFSDAVIGIVPENIVAAANAAKALSDMTSSIPNEGGMVAWFTGENSVSRFADDIVTLGYGLKGFSNAVLGIVPENVISAANAAKALADMTASIPNEGGLIAWFTGESSVSKFADQLPLLGMGLKGFSDAVMGIVPENVTAAASAAKSLAEMADTIPNEGGMVAWFAGENSISKFGSELPLLGYALKGFSDAVTGIVPENLTAAAGAAKSLAEMTETLPNEGGIKAWFTGESSVSAFAGKLPVLGAGLKGFSDAIAGIVPENVTAAANAAKALAEMTAVIPKEGGIKAWFTGESSISTFAGKLPTLGKGLKGFSDSVAGISPENVTAAANAAKSLGEMTSTIPGDTSKVSSFGDNLVKFGEKLKSYFSKTSGISEGAISASKKAIETVKEVTTLQSGNISSTATAIKDIAKALKELAKVPKNCASEFTKALKVLGEDCADALLKGLTDAKPDFKDAGKDAIDAFAKGVEANEKKAKTACKNVITDCVDAIGDSSSKFKTAGKNLVVGFAEGISANTFKAEAKARAMAKAAAEAAEEALDINSPSKVGYGIGDFFGIGFVNALSDNIQSSYTAGFDVAEAARKGLSAAAARIQSLVNGDMDMQPTITPVLNLSNVKTGVNAISSMLGAGSSLGLSANVGAISTMMNRRNQNGDSEVVSALNKLREDIGNLQHASYTINGITYDDGSNISEAVQSLVRAAKVERRI